MSRENRTYRILRSRRMLITMLGVMIVCLLGVLFILSSIVYGVVHRDIVPPPLLGNKPDNISRVNQEESRGQPFSFLVVGDTRTSDIFEKFYNTIHLEYPPEFGVILGDFVAHPDRNRHRFFSLEFSEWGMKYPIFLVAGNHDIICGRKDRAVIEPFHLTDFEEMYGPENFTFTHEGCLFIGLNDVYTDSYLHYARDVLSRKAADSRMIFVFMHIPSQTISPVIDGRGIEKPDEFIDLMDRYGVDYVFSGDYHSYFRGEHKHTNYIVTGGGGSSLTGGISRSFHHLLLVRVNPAAHEVDEIIYPIDEAADILDDIEIVFLCQLFPYFSTHPIAWGAVFTLMALCLAVCGVRLLMNMRRRPRV